MSLGTTALWHIAIFVKDIRKAVSNWNAVLGREPDPPPAVPGRPASTDPVWFYPRPDQVPGFTHGESGDYSDCQLVCYTLENFLLELVEPGPNSGPWKEAFDKYGEGVHNISFVVPDRKAAQDALKAIGAPGPYHLGYWPKGTHAFVDTKAQLGVELNIKTTEDNTEKVKLLKTNPDLHKQDI